MLKGVKPNMYFNSTSKHVPLHVSSGGFGGHKEPDRPVPLALEEATSAEDREVAKGEEAGRIEEASTYILLLHAS